MEIDWSLCEASTRAWLYSVCSAKCLYIKFCGPVQILMPSFLANRRPPTGLQFDKWMWHGKRVEEAWAEVSGGTVPGVNIFFHTLIQP